MPNISKEFIVRSRNDGVVSRKVLVYVHKLAINFSRQISMLSISNTITSNYSGPTPGNSETLQGLLDSHAVHGDAFAVQHETSSFLVARMLGEAPAAFHTYAIYPSTMIIYKLCMFIMTDNKKLSQKLTRLAGIVTSLVAQCAYCSAVACGLGDVFNGAVTVTTPLNLAPSDVSNPHRIALRLCVAATKVPARVSPEMRNENREIFGGEAGLQQLGNIVATSGFKNSLNSLLGTEIDRTHTDNAEIAFQNTSYSFGPHKFASRFRSSYKKFDKNSSIFGFIVDFFQSIHHQLKFLAETQAILKQVPSTHVLLNRWLSEKFRGFTPRYLSDIINLETKRSFCTVLTQSIFTEEPFTVSSNGTFAANLPLSDKIILAFVYFSGASNNLLVAHFAFIAHSLDIPATRLSDALDRAQKFNHKDSTSPQSAMDVMIPLTYYAARRYHKRMWRVSPWLYPQCGQNPATILAYCNLVSVFTFLHRYSAVVDDGKGFEMVVKVFVVSSYGTSCGLAVNQAGCNSSGFLASLEERDIDWDDVDISTVQKGASSLRLGVGEIVGPYNLWGGNVDY
ncbi:hypothetical protein HK100_009706 [Physocladia obscura]|uniref:Uncharacterized protein n=1 Tax=Physocladia obscura TaxID=109957 RepID=A0AAD5XHV8_9FUNG|nr:hypothetical protein HK100_009706 [Physocladia obscura]